MRGYRAFRKLVRLRADPALQLRGYAYAAYPEIPDMVVYRKMLDHWYIFVIWDSLAHLRIEDLETYKINLLRVAVDQPYGQYVRDKQGVYIPGSLVGAVYPSQGYHWEYRSVEQLDAQVRQALLAIADRIPWLEHPESTMGYTS